MAVEMTHRKHSTLAFGSAESVHWMNPALWLNLPEDMI